MVKTKTVKPPIFCCFSMVQGRTKILNRLKLISRIYSENIQDTLK